MILAIAGRELRATFNTATGWLVLTGYLFLTGLVWSASFSMYVEQMANLLDNPYAAEQASLGLSLVAPVMQTNAVILLLLVPAISMRLFAEEYRQRTFELLLTSPATTAQIVVGKFAGAAGFVTVLIGLAAYAPLSLMLWGRPDLGVIGGGVLALWLLALLLVAMGTFFSSLTESQVVAMVLTFAGALGSWLLTAVDDDPASIWQQLSPSPHLVDLTHGLVNLSDVAYFAVAIAFFLFAAHQSVDSHRWS